MSFNTKNLELRVDKFQVLTIIWNMKKNTQGKQAQNPFVSGFLIKGKEYKWFMPELVNKSYKWENPKIDVLLEDTARQIGELNVYATLIPDIEYYIKAHIAIEATMSSRIEGTNTNIDEVFKDKEYIDPEKRNDYLEIHSYIKAMDYGIERLETFPLSVRLTKEMHKILLDNSRGYNKLPGKARQSQNWIGGSNPSNARFVPPHYEEVGGLMSDLEKFWHNDELNIPELIKIAISHYQFETIHPFLDGNGRIGRLLIIMQLITKGILEKPCLYLSYFVDKRRLEYYNAFTVVREKNDMDSYLVLFLEIFSEAAFSGIEVFKKILRLDKEYADSIEGAVAQGRQKKAKELIKMLYSRPLITVQQTANVLNSSFQTALSLINEMTNASILEETTGMNKNRIFVLKKYFDILNGGF